MNTKLFTVPVFVNNKRHVRTLIDDSCQSYSLISQSTVQDLNLPLLPLPRPIIISGYDNVPANAIIKNVAVISTLDIAGSI